MKFIEMTRKVYNRNKGQYGEYEVGGKFMMDFESGWEIDDSGPDKPAHWVNMKLGMNHDVNDTYAELKTKFIKAGLLLDLDNVVPKSDSMKFTIKTKVSPVEVLGDSMAALMSTPEREVYIDNKLVPRPLAEIILIGLNVASEQYFSLIKEMMDSDQLEYK